MEQNEKRSNQLRKLEKLNIVAYLYDRNEGCNYSGFFRDNFINKGNLHPDVKLVKVGVVQITGKDSIPKVVLMNEQVKLLRQEGNRINPAELQQYILRHIDWKENKEIQEEVSTDSSRCKTCNLSKEKMLGNFCKFESCPTTK